MAYLKLRYDMKPYGTKIITQQATTHVTKNFQIAPNSDVITQFDALFDAKICVFQRNFRILHRSLSPTKH